MPTLPTDVSGKLVPYTPEQIALMDIRRRGMESSDHVAYNLGPDGSGCTRRFSCRWDQRFNAAIYFAGAATLWFDSGAGVQKLSRLVPQKDPDYPAWLCTKCEIMPWRYTGTVTAPVAGTEALPNYERADLSCTYEMVPFAALSDEDAPLGPLPNELNRYVSGPGYPGADITGETQYISLPGGAQQFRTASGTGKPAGVSVPHGIGLPENKRRFKIVWRRVPLAAWVPGAPLFDRVFGVPGSGTRSWIGSLNKTALIGYDALQLQLATIEERLLPDPTGLGYSWELGFVFDQKPVPFGHTGLYFHDTATSGNVSGYYQFGRAGISTNQAAAAIGDNDCMFHVREHADLFKVS